VNPSVLYPSGGAEEACYLLTNSLCMYILYITWPWPSLMLPVVLTLRQTSVPSLRSALGYSLRPGRSAFCLDGSVCTVCMYPMTTGAAFQCELTTWANAGDA